MAKLCFWTGMGFVLTAVVIMFLAATVESPPLWLSKIGGAAYQLHQQVFVPLLSIGFVLVLSAAPLKLLELRAQRD